MDIRKLTKLALLTAAALIIFIIELQFPTLAPVPGMKLGLANIVTVYAVYSFTGAETAAMVIVRVVLGSLIAGNLMAMAYSMGGALLCLAGMLLLRRVIDKKHIWVCSVLGAVLHNIGQTAVAVVLMQTATVIFYLPFLLAAGCLAGALTGYAAQLLVSRMNK